MDTRSKVVACPQHPGQSIKKTKSTCESTIYAEISVAQCLDTNSINRGSLQFESSRVGRGVMPTIGEMINNQLGLGWRATRPIYSRPCDQGSAPAVEVVIAAA